MICHLFAQALELGLVALRDAVLHLQDGVYCMTPESPECDPTIITVWDGP